MGDEIDFENRRISNFKGLVTLTLTLTVDRVIRHTVVHHSSTSTYIPNFIGIGKLFVDGRTETHIIRSTLRSRPKNCSYIDIHTELKSIVSLYAKQTAIPPRLATLKIAQHHIMNIFTE